MKPPPAVPEGTYSKRWVASNILGLSDSEFLRNQRETFYDRKYQQALEGMAEDAAAEEAFGAEGGLGDLGGGLGGEEGLEGELGDLDLGGEEGAAPEEEDESALLTTPGRREDNPTKHEGAPHTPVSSDSRRRGASGPRSRKLRRQAKGLETNTYRKNAGAGIGNPRGDMPDVRFGLEEQEEPTYNKNETMLYENTTKVRRLVEQMEKKEATKDEA